MRALQRTPRTSNASAPNPCRARPYKRVGSLAAPWHPQSQHTHTAAVAAAVQAEQAPIDADDEQSTSYRSQEEPSARLPEMQLRLPEPTNVLVKAAEFIKSSVTVADCPPPKYPDFAVIGRSNVGKSSLINMLTGRKSLAMVSKEPGKTRCINHFLINNSWYLVDLPGYGYARTGRDNRREFDEFTKSYFLQRPTLTMVFLLVDSSIPPQSIDMEYAVWLASKSVPFSIVFTKADKRKKGQPKHRENITAFKRALVEQHGFAAVPPTVVTGAAAGIGKQELLQLIAGLRVLYEQQAKAAKR